MINNLDKQFRNLIWEMRKGKALRHQGRLHTKKWFGQIFKNGLGLENEIGNNWTLSSPPPKKKQRKTWRNVGGGE